MPHLVSVIIPVFNGQAFLRNAIDSVLGQTYAQREIIAVDDGSTDDSADILRSYGSRITVVTQKNSGVSTARNVGIDRANGNLIAFLDQDDWWNPEKLEAQLKAIDLDSSVGFVHSDALYFDDVRKQEVTSFNNVSPYSLVGNCYDILALGNGILNSTVVVRRDVLHSVGGFSNEIRENSVQDYELWLRCARVTRFACVPEQLITYRIHPGQGMWNVRKSHQQLAAMLERIVGRPESHESRKYRERFSTLLAELGVEHLDAGTIGDARTCFRRAARIWPSHRNSLYAGCSHLPLWCLNLLRSARSHGRAFVGRRIDSKLPQWTGRINNDVQRTEILLPAESQSAGK